MPKVEKLNALVGAYVNLAYPLPSGASVKFLDDQTTYLGSQLKSEFDSGRCFDVLASIDFIMVCTYEDDKIDAVYDGILIYAIVLHVAVLAIAIFNSIVTAGGTYNISAYIMHFVMGCMGFLMSIWGIGIILFVIVVNLLSILITDISAIGCSITLYKNNIISKGLAILGAILSFVFCADVVISIFYYAKAQNATKSRCL